MTSHLVSPSQSCSLNSCTVPLFDFIDDYLFLHRPMLLAFIFYPSKLVYSGYNLNFLLNSLKNSLNTLLDILINCVHLIYMSYLEELSTLCEKSPNTIEI